MPKKSKIQTQIVAATDKVGRATRPGRARGKPPTPDEMYKAALACPTFKDLAAYFGVVYKTVQNWVDANDRLRVALDRARQEDVLELLAAARQKALDGSHPHLKSYLQAVRPDLVQPDSAVQVNVNSNTVKVLPAPKQKLERPKPPIIDITPTDDTNRTPLFNDSPRPIPAGPPATGLQRG